MFDNIDNLILLNQFEVSNLLDVSLNRLDVWSKNGKLLPYEYKDNIHYYNKSDLLKFDKAKGVFNSKWEEFIQIKPKQKYTSIELFAGAGGLGLGMEMAGIDHILLNEIDKYASQTLRLNRPKWNVMEGDIGEIDFSEYKGKVDVVSGGFPCQAFSHAGKKRGFEDTRGTLFFEFARCIKEVQPKIFIGENVKGLLNHDNGRTLDVIRGAIKELGYTLIEPTVLNSMYYKVPQKRERLILVGVRNDYLNKISNFKFPEKYNKVLTVRDALFKGELFDTDAPESIGSSYPEKKKEVMDLVPEGGYWKDLPEAIQKEYMGGSYFLGGGKTGLARRLSLDNPSLTIVCAPAMKQTERCHPIETRPLTVRESARIQTFPDDWEFYGGATQQYKQIGNAVPVNLAYAIGLSVIDFLNNLD